MVTTKYTNSNYIFSYKKFQCQNEWNFWKESTILLFLSYYTISLKQKPFYQAWIVLWVILLVSLSGSGSNIDIGCPIKSKPLTAPYHQITIFSGQRGKIEHWISNIRSKTIIIFSWGNIVCYVCIVSRTCHYFLHS